MKKKNEARQNFSKIILLMVVICLAVIIIAKIIQNKAVVSPYFNVQYVDIVGERDIETIKEFVEHNVLNKNIFKINLHDLSNAVAKKFPYVSKVLLIRRFPNKIEVVTTLRKPLAKVKLYSGSVYYLDSDAALFLQDKAFEENAALPVVDGLNNDPSKTELRKIVDLLQSIDSVSIKPDLIVSSIEVDSRGECSFVANGINIKIGERDFKNRLDKLKLIFDEPNFAKEKIKYIDIRFKEPSLVYSNK